MHLNSKTTNKKVFPNYLSRIQNVFNLLIISFIWWKMHLSRMFHQSFHTSFTEGESSSFREWFVYPLWTICIPCERFVYLVKDNGESYLSQELFYYQWIADRWKCEGCLAWILLRWYPASFSSVDIKASACFLISSSLMFTWYVLSFPHTPPSPLPGTLLSTGVTEYQCKDVAPPCPHCISSTVRPLPGSLLPLRHP